MPDLTKNASVADLFSDITPDIFVERYWNQRWYLGAPCAETIEALTGGAPTLDTWREAFRRAYAWPGAKPRLFGLLGARQFVSITPAQADPILASGRTVIGGILDHGVTRLAARLKAELGIPGGIDTSASISAPGEAANPHYDGPHVFVFQVAGRKQWTLSRERLVHNPKIGRVLNPDGTIDLSDVSENDVEDPDVRLGECDTVVLEPGSWLYVPAGTVHSTVALEESLSFMVDVKPARFDQVADRAFRRAHGGPGTELPPMAGAGASLGRSLLAGAAEWAADLSPSHPAVETAWAEMCADLGALQTSFQEKHA